MAPKKKQKSPTTWMPNSEDVKLIQELKNKTGVMAVSELIRMGLRKLAQAEGIGQ